MIGLSHLAAGPQVHIVLTAADEKTGLDTDMIHRFCRTNIPATVLNQTSTRQSA